jgi:DNA-binding transcriptional LysR family regulator
MDLREADTTALCRALSAGNVDVAFIRPPAVDFADLRVDELFDEDMLVALPTGHRLASSVMVPLAALAGEPFILYPRWLAPSLYDAVLAACCKAGFVPDIVQEAPQVAAAINLVAAGFGTSIVPASMRQIHGDGVVYRPLLGAMLRAPLSLASRRDERSAAVRNFIALARNAASQRRTTLAG